MRLKQGLLSALLVSLCATPALAGGGPLGIDHEWQLDTSGVWAQKYQSALEYGSIAAAFVGGVYYGRNDPLGHVFWQSVDSTALAAASAGILKLAFSRARPNQGDNPSLWFQGG